MLTIECGRLKRSCRGMSRRTALRVGALGGLSLPWLLEQQGLAAEGRAVKDTSVVLLTLNGGPSQFETFDPKMDAPSEIRSVTGEIKTKLAASRSAVLSQGSLHWPTSCRSSVRSAPATVDTTCRG